MHRRVHAREWLEFSGNIGVDAQAFDGSLKMSRCRDFSVGKLLKAGHDRGLIVWPIQVIIFSRIFDQARSKAAKQIGLACLRKKWKIRRWTLGVKIILLISLQRNRFPQDLLLVHNRPKISQKSRQRFRIRKSIVVVLFWGHFNGWKVDNCLLLNSWSRRR